jgi:hypothetical protein
MNVGHVRPVTLSREEFAMFLLHTASGNLIRVEDLDELFSPAKSGIRGRDQAGEEEQEVTWFVKEELVFPSGEVLPRCWTDINYRHARSAACHRAESHRQEPVEMEM